MDQDAKPKRELNPKETANIFSLLSFFYSLKIFRKGFRKELEEDDLYEVLSSCNSKTAGDQLEDQWELDKKKHGSNRSIYRVLWRCYGKTYMIFGGAQLLMRTIVVLVIPEATGKLISYFAPGQTKLSKEDAYYYAALAIVLNIVQHIYTQNYMIAITEFGIKVRTAICSLVYRKTLRFSNTSHSETSMGRIVTLITKDVHAIEALLLFANDIWIGVIETGIICYLMYGKIGSPAFVGVGFFLFVLPLQALIGKMATMYRLKTSKKTDERLQITQEVLSAIRIIKMYTWEKIFENKISATRKKELREIHKLFYMKVIILLIGGLSSKIAFFLLLMTYVWLGNPITAEIVYFLTSCFTKLRHFLSMLIPLGISFMAEFHATKLRLTELLEAEELPSPRGYAVDKIPKITLENASVNVRGIEIFKNVTLEIEKGLNIIVGHIGSGKSTFLKTILEDCEVNGHLRITGSISYASQEPWLFPSTVRNNILFGEAYNEKKYKEVLEKCALVTDLESFVHGDNTIVGDRGVNLSKGQQARINLARAVYRDSDIYLLDDCLASLDGKVGAYVFRECIKEYLKEKVVVFVTNHLEHIRQGDKVILIDKGVAKYEEKSVIVVEEKREEKEEVVQETKPKAVVSEAKNEIKNLYHENKKAGKVDIAVYKRLLQYGGGYFPGLLVLGLFVAFQAAFSYSEKLLSKWVTLEEDLSNFKVKNGVNSTEYIDGSEKRINMITLYMCLIGSLVIIYLLESFAFFTFMRRASIKLHKVLMSSILSAKMLFFDSHLIGNVLNRFSRDFGIIDEYLPFVIKDCIGQMFTAAGIIFLIITVNAIFLIPVGVLFAVGYLLRNIYLRTGRSLQRLESATRSPLIGHLNASLEGLTTIRAFKAQEMIKDEFDRHQDLYTSANYTAQNCSRALAFFLDMMCSIFIVLVIARFLLMPLDTTVGNVGLAISQAFALTGLLQYGVRRWSDFENNMTSVERVLEYTEVDQETKDGKPIEDWPRQGQIDFSKVTLRYSDDGNDVLKNISFSLSPQKKLGIVGRTGAGKSSIVSVLFRLYDILGEIKIDGVDIKTLPVNFLRSNIAIIPQDPILFSGTVRDNIDPLKNLEDEAIWKIIKNIKLDGLITDLSLEIDNISLNMSAGQKQLICLARAMARQNKIVVLDEATASMDEESDELIREVIKQSFGSTTMIVIAHRMASVLSCDSVMVIDGGRILEHDSTSNLLNDKSSIFHEMVKRNKTD